jgi:hypothetical protein
MNNDVLVNGDAEKDLAAAGSRKELADREAQVLRLLWKVGELNQENAHLRRLVESLEARLPGRPGDAVPPDEERPP